ncbi:MAG: ATPase, T2SS/T4P/T4SS family [Bdellovibrionota bacterium]
MTIGSGTSADIQLKAISNEFELEIKRAQSAYWLINLSRSNSIRVNGKKIDKDISLKNGDQILVDEHKIFLEIQSGEEIYNSLENSRFNFRRQPESDELLWRYLIDENEFDEILINGSSEIYVDFQGNLLKTPWYFQSEEFLKSKIPGSSDAKNSWISWRESRRLRFQAALPPVVEKIHLAIRKARQNVFSLKELEEKEFGTPEQIRFLKNAIAKRESILISGAASTGKTVLLRSLVENISENERIVILEEEAETDWPHPHALAIEAGRSNLREALIQSLRLRPSRILLSEIRGAEAFEFLQALNTGHEGGMTTIHANSERDALSRIENLILTTGLAVNPLAVRAQIAQALQIIVQLERLSSGQRRIQAISRVSGIQQGTILLGDPVRFEGSGIGLVK